MGRAEKAGTLGGGPEKNRDKGKGEGKANACALAPLPQC